MLLLGLIRDRVGVGEARHIVRAITRLAVAVDGCRCGRRGETTGSRRGSSTSGGGRGGGAVVRSSSACG